MFVEVQDLIGGDAHYRVSGEVVRVSRNGSFFAVVERDARTEEGIFDMREHRDADRRVERSEHVLGQVGNGRKWRLLDIAFALGGDIVINISNCDDARVFVDIGTHAIERESRAVHALVMLHGSEFYPFGKRRLRVQDMMTIDGMLDIGFIIFAFQGVDVLVEQALRELCLADVVQEAGKHDIFAFFAVEMHPFGDDAGENGNAQRVVVYIAG